MFSFAEQFDQTSVSPVQIEIFERVLRLRPDEPHSYRDLALVLAKRAMLAIGSSNGNKSAIAELERYDGFVVVHHSLNNLVCFSAISLLSDVVLKKWDSRFDEIG